MQNEVFERISEAGKSSCAALQELSAINSKAFMDLTELQLSLAAYSIESGVALTKTLGASGNYQDFLSARAEYANEYGGKMIEYSHKTAAVLNESRDEVAGWLEKTIESMTAAPKKPAARRAPAKSAKKQLDS